MRYLPSTPLLLAIPLGKCSELELSSIWVEAMVEAHKKTILLLNCRRLPLLASIKWTIETRLVSGSYSSRSTTESGRNVSRLVARAAGSVELWVLK